MGVTAGGSALCGMLVHFLEAGPCSRVGKRAGARASHLRVARNFHNLILTSTFDPVQPYISPWILFRLYAKKAAGKTFSITSQVCLANHGSVVAAVISNGRMSRMMRSVKTISVTRSWRLLGVGNKAVILVGTRKAMLNPKRPKHRVSRKKSAN